MGHPSLSENIELRWELRGVEPLPLQLHQIEPPVGAQVCYLLGIEGLDSLLPWLRGDGERQLVVLEAERGKIVSWLQGRESLPERLHLGTVGQAEQFMAEFVGRRADCRVTPGHDDQLALKLIQSGAMSTTLVDEVRQVGDLFYENFYANLLELPGCFSAARLRGKFQGVPAIIAGAGPSLDRNADGLMRLRNRALLFAGGSALNALSNRGIRPHFGAGLDPHHAQLQRILTNSAYELPMFFRGRWNREILPLLQGPKLYLGGAGGYPVADWIDGRLGIEPLQVDEGLNVIHMCIGIAKQLGCSPIILVGMDLALTEGRLYADEIVHDPGFEPHHFYDLPVERPGIDGEPVQTLWKWIAEAEWLGQQGDLINATEGGLGIEGVPAVPLSQLGWGAARELEREVHEAIMGGELQVERPEILGLLRELEASLERAQAHLQALPGLAGGAAALHEVELEEEIAYPLILEGLATIWRAAHPNQDRIPYLQEAAETNLRLLREVIR